jgi:hypothetical protein
MNKSNIFYGCISIISLPNTSKLDAKNIEDKKYIFYKCKSLKLLPDISQ